MMKFIQNGNLFGKKEVLIKKIKGFIEAKNLKIRYEGSKFNSLNGLNFKIFPGELGKAIKLIKEGKDIDYVGATALELVGSGESAGSFAEILIDNQKTNKVGYR